jgi:hypothetical protein
MVAGKFSIHRVQKGGDFLPPPWQPSTHQLLKTSSHCPFPSTTCSLLKRQQLTSLFCQSCSSLPIHCLMTCLCKASKTPQHTITLKVGTVMSAKTLENAQDMALLIPEIWSYTYL